MIDAVGLSMGDNNVGYAVSVDDVLAVSGAWVASKASTDSPTG